MTDLLHTVIFFSWLNCAVQRVQVIVCTNNKMLRSSLTLLYDSFAAHRTEVRSVLKGVSIDHVKRNMQRYMLAAPALRRAQATDTERQHDLRRHVHALVTEISRLHDRRHSHEQQAPSPYSECDVACAALEVLRDNADALRSFHVELQPQWLKSFLSTTTNVSDAHRLESLVFEVQQVLPVAGGLSQHSLLHGSGAVEHSSVVPAGAVDEMLSVPQEADALTAADQKQAGAVAVLAQHRLATTVSPNDSFTRYFLKQKIVNNEGELAVLVRCMRQRALTVIRVHRSSPFAAVAVSMLSARPSFQRVAWAPSYALCFTLDSGALHNSNGAKGGAALHGEGPSSVASHRVLLQALLDEKVCSLQSASSLLPVLLLDPSPQDLVLDMCAAPGSKSMMILDSFHRAGGANASMQESGPCGCLVVNDGSLHRASATVDRVGGMHPSTVILSSDAAQFPLPSKYSGAVGIFDKVLLDAPCSGEGRIGRNSGEWRLWHPRRGVDFHRTQKEMLSRAIDAAKVGGIIVYSTCTLNPLENEAVVCEMVRRGIVEPLDPAALPKELRLSSGMTTWVVPSSSGGYLTSFGDGQREGDALITESMFAESSPEAVRSAVARCARRVMPHLVEGNMEAFFVVTLRKVRCLENPSASVKETISAPTSLLRQSGSVYSTLSNSSVRAVELLSPFFVGFDVNAVLQRAGVRLLEDRRSNRIEGAGCPMFLVSDSSIRFLSESSSSASAHPARQGENASASNSLATSNRSGELAKVLSIGALVFDHNGKITESGCSVLAGLLRCTGQLVSLPMHESQLLLSNRSINIARRYSSPAEAALRAMRNGAEERAEVGAPPAWVVQLFDRQRTREGNAIVMTSLSSEDATGHSLHHHRADCLFIPIHVECNADCIDLRLLLPHAERRRAVAMLNRVRASSQSAHRFSAERSGAKMEEISLRAATVKSVAVARKADAKAAGAMSVSAKEKLLRRLGSSSSVPPAETNTASQVKWTGVRQGDVDGVITF